MYDLIIKYIWAFMDRGYFVVMKTLQGNSNLFWHRILCVNQLKYMPTPPPLLVVDLSMPILETFACISLPL